MINLDKIMLELREGLIGVTPGPWYPGHLGEEDHPCNCRSITEEGYAGGIASVHVDNGIKLIEEGGNDAPPEAEAAANMRHIARCSPEVIAALLDEIEFLRNTMSG